jgi:phosphatidylglycerophosphatase A
MPGVSASRWICILSTWFGCGRVPRAPGTVGTLGALPLAWGLTFLPLTVQVVSILVFVVFTIVVAQAFEDQQGVHDEPAFVMDEVAGFLVAAVGLPWTWMTVLLAFVVFRFLDAVKPWPISWVDRRVRGGFGVVADDLLAGVLTGVLLHVGLHQGWWG